MLAQLATVKLRLGIELFDTTQDDVLTSLLKHVSARFAAECNRVFDYGSGIPCEFRADQISINVDRPPIQSVSAFSLKDSEQDGWIEQSNVKYLLLPQRAILELALPLGSRAQLGRLTYTGG